MSKLRVHELARELGRQNREVIEFLKSKGVDVRSHMSMVDESAVSEVKNRFRKDNNNRGKEHIAKLETPKTEEKVVTAKSEGDKTETPKKKKNIIRVFHAQNASDGGKTRKKPGNWHLIWEDRHSSNSSSKIPIPVMSANTTGYMHGDTDAENVRPAS